MGSPNLWVFLLVPFCFILHTGAQNLRYGYYRRSCPGVEAIVYRKTAELVAKDETLAAPLLRMQFHDCFVRGCDASVLLNSTKKFTAEKDSAIDATLSGFAEIDLIKATVERRCPGVVSCADILTMVARDSVYLNNGPYYKVPLGRRDGTVSSAAEAQANLPPHTFNISQLISLFNSKGLSIKDLVVLSGAHTIGQGHCNNFINRLYNFSRTSSIDPSLNSKYAHKLRKECAGPDPSSISVDMDFKTPTKFDIDYYKIVKEHKGLFETDAALLDNGFTKAYVDFHSTHLGKPTFFQDFAESMVKMGKIQVLVGKQGQIRKICSKVNSP